MLQQLRWRLESERAWRLVTLAERDQKEGGNTEAHAKLERAEGVYRDLVHACVRKEGENSALCAGFLSDFGSVRSRQGNHQEARAILERALAIKRRVHRPNHAEIGTAWWELGIASERWGRPADAEAYLRKALEVDERGRNDRRSIVGDECHELGLVCLQQHKYSEALDWFCRARGIRLGVLGEHSHDYQQSWICAAWILFNLGRYHECEQEMGELLAVTRRTFGESSVHYGMRLMLYARTLAVLERPESVETARRAMELLEEVGPIPDIATSQARDAVIQIEDLVQKVQVMSPCESLVASGRYQEAARCYQNCLAEDPGPADEAIQSAILSRLVDIHLRLDNLDDAYRCAQRALAIDGRRCVNEPGILRDNDLAASLMDMGMVLAQRGDVLGADSFYEQSDALDRRTLAAEPSSTLR